MKLTTKGRYAVTAMLDLALHQESRAVTLREIADSQKISLSYLEQLFSKLRRSDLVAGTRGPGGGYQLARPAGEISIAEIIQAVDEPMEFTECHGKKDCRDGERCLAHELWETLTDQLEGFMSEIYLGELMVTAQQSIEAQRAAINNAAQQVAVPSM